MTTDLIELRCKHCGAPLESEDIGSDAPYVKCQYCGTTQQRVDAKAYMNQMMDQIRSWVSRSIPGGFSLAQTENVDPIARHNIYVNNIQPAIMPEISEFRIAVNTLMGNSLIVLPFTTDKPARTQHTSNQAFEFNARLKSIEPLAVDTEQKKIIVDAQNLSAAYALLVNNIQLLCEKTDGRFALMSTNFQNAAASIARCEGYEVLQKRLNALAGICTASDMVLNGDSLGCAVKAESAIAELEEAKKAIMKSPRLAMMLRAINLELAQSRSLLNAADKDNTGSGDGSALETLELMSQIKNLQYPSSKGWNDCLNKNGREHDLYAYVEEIERSRKEGGLLIASGDGDILYPFWDVDLKYSFTTGSLFSKKAVEVSEDILVPATFTLDGQALNNPVLGLTDIFGNAPESTLMSRIKGAETSISGGAGIGRLADSASPGSPGNRKVVVPTSTKSDAVKLVDQYLRLVSSTHGKLKLSSPTVKRMFYVPCMLVGDSIELPSMLSGLEPRSVAALGTSRVIIL